MRDICNLCGVTFQPAPRLLRPGQALNWRCEIRAVDRRHGSDATQLTGVGLFFDDRIIGPGDPAQTYLEPAALDHFDRHIIGYCSESWTFAFHNACWELLLIQLARLLPASISQDLDQVGHYLFNLLYSLPLDRYSIPFPAHDFGGAASINLSDIPSNWRFLWAELKVPCFDPTVPGHQHGLDKLTVLPDPRSVRQYSHDGDLFARLPLEIVWLILSSLSSLDICSCRLSSRTLAAIATPGCLPQSFWCTRFYKDNELGFLCIKIPPSRYSVDWEDWHRVAQAGLRNTSELGYLRNRRRIWRSLRHLTDCLVPLLEQNLTLLPPGAPGSQLMAQDHVLGHIIRGHARYDGDVAGGQHGVGSRLMGVGYINFSFHSAEASAPYEIRVSFLRFDCSTYICGLRCLEQGGSCGSEISRVGLITPSSETTLKIGSGEYISGLRVATTVSGVTGMTFMVCQSQGEGERLLSAGPVHSLPQGTGQATLRPASGRKLLGAVIGFDACKFVSVQLVERLSETPDCNNPQSLLVNLHNPLESPEISNALDDLEMIDPPQPFLFTDMKFGGPGGVWLSLLSRVVAYHDDLGDDIRGFAFHYLDGTSVTYGSTDITESAARRWTCVEHTVAIDGLGGERIINLEYVLGGEGLSRRVRAIKMATNWARYLTFCSSSCFPEAESWVLAQNLNDENATTITGIVARTQFSTGYINSLATYGVEQHQRGPLLQQEAEELTFSVDRSCMNKSPRSNSVKCYTTVSLTGIRRLSVSGGAPGKTRTKNHVSGLRLDFFRSTTPIYVGQWFSEIGSLQLEPGDGIAGLTFWQTQETDPNAAVLRRENAGRIAGISITKTGSSEPKQLEICLQDKLDLLEYSFHENNFEDLCGIVWAFNHEVDYIQTVTRPPASKHGKSLFLHDLLDVWHNFRFPGKLLWEVTGDANIPLPVTTIHVAFQKTSLAGFIFEYGGGKARRSAGCTSGETYAMVLQEGEIPCRMDVVTWGVHHAIIFHTNLGQTKAFSSAESSQSPLERPTEDFDTYMLGVSADQESHLVRGQENGTGERQQQKVCVGIWVTMRIHDKSHRAVEAVGPIFVKNAS